MDKILKQIDELKETVKETENAVNKIIIRLDRIVKILNLINDRLDDEGDVFP